MAYPTSNITSTKTTGQIIAAQHVNELQGAAEMTLRIVNNGSGATRSVGDVGYIDSAGDFQTTTTAYLAANWAVVVVGGSNGADIVVAIGGTGVTVTLDGNCSVGDYLYTSTTAAKGTTETYVRPEVIGVATTANSSGDGGTAEFLLLCQRKFVPATDSNDVFRVNSSSDSDWSATCNGAPSGTTVTYNTPLSSGSEDCIVPNSSSELAKLVLHNTTQGEYALIESVDTGANTITVTDSNDVSGWANNDAIQVTSQTVATGSAYLAFDLEFLDTSVVPALATGIVLDAQLVDAGSAVLFTHPYETHGTSKRQGIPEDDRRTMNQKIIERRFCYILDASGVATGTSVLRLLGYVMAAP